jgi:hypothetical protein
LQLLVFARGEGLLASLVPWATSGQVACFVFSQIPWTEAVFSLGQPWVLLLANKQVENFINKIFLKLKRGLEAS